MAFLRPATPRHLHLLPEVRHPRRLPTLLAMAAAAGIAQYPTTAIAVALPELHRQLNASLGELQWTITAFTLAMSAFLIASGRLSDILGRRRILLAGVALFAGGSAIAALAGSAEVLIAGTAFAGLGAAAIAPSSLSIVVNAYPPGERGLPIGIWGAATAIAQGIGPLVGGVLAGELGWEWIFWADVAVAAAIVGAVLWATAESRNPAAERHIDATGLAIAAAALVCLSLAVIQAPTWGLGATQTLVLLAVAAVLAVAFVVVERRFHAPLVNFAFFRARNFTGATIALFVLNFAFMAALFFLPLFLQEMLGSSATESGVQLLPLMGMLILMLPLGGPIAQRVGPLPPIVLGLGAMAIGLLLLAGIDRGTGYGDLWLPMALTGGGAGTALTPMNLAAMNAIPTRESGAAGGLFTTLSGIGISFGVAITGAVFSSSQLSGTERLAAQGGVGISSEQAESLDGLLAGDPAARATLEQFSRADRGTLEEAVREAFVDALGDAYRVGGLVALGGLVLALVLIRRRPPADVVEAEPERVELAAGQGPPAGRPGR